METVEITEIKSAEMLEAINRSEVDIQISTAKKYPRDIERSRRSIEALACIDEETAEECFYALRRKDADGSDTVIEGPSVRLAEIVASCWGNLRVQTNIIGNDGRFITARGICHDLESNYAVASEVKRRITNKKGKTFSDDMQVVTGNAAGAIAFRNAVFKVVPPAVMKPIFAKVKDMAMGQGEADIAVKRQNMVKFFAGEGVSLEMILSYVEVKTLEEIDKELLFQLRGAATAIKEGTATARDIFIKPYEEKQSAQRGEAQKSEAEKMIEKAMNPQPEQGPEGGMFDGEDLP